jgi:hypothetical protein
MAFDLSYSSTGGAATEARQFVVSNGVLYCALGNWMSSPAGQPRVIRRDAAGAAWEVETWFPPETMACACMAALNFGSRVVLACGFFGRSYVATRSVAGQWTLTKLGAGTNRVQIRSFGMHADNQTKNRLAFAGHDTGIFSGTYDATAEGSIRWGASPELDTSQFPTMSGGHPQRVTSFAELGRRLYAAIGQSVWRRTDGARPKWTRVWINPNPGTSQTGCRGLTAINGALWVGVEGTNSRIVSLDPTTWVDTTLYDVSGPKHYYQIVAYNNFCVTKAANGAQIVLAGMDATQTMPARYLARVGGTWCSRPIAMPAITSHPMVALRTIIESPFHDGVLYWGGYDCNSHESADTAWIATSAVSDVGVMLEEQEEQEIGAFGRYVHHEDEDEDENEGEREDRTESESA